MDQDQESTLEKQSGSEFDPWKKTWSDQMLKPVSRVDQIMKTGSGPDLILITGSDQRKDSYVRGYQRRLCHLIYKLIIVSKAEFSRLTVKLKSWYLY